MSNPDNFLKIFCAIFLMVGLGLLAGAGYFTYQNYLSQTTFIKTTGKVVRTVGGETTRSVVEYQAEDSQTYTLTSTVGSNPPAHRVGDTVTVLYPPSRPDEGQLGSFLELWFAPLLMGGMGAIFAGIGGGMWGYGWYRQQVVARLKETGLALQAEFVSVDRNTSLEVNGQYPFQVVTQYRDKAANKVYTFKSDNLWFDPSEYLDQKTLTVLVNPQNYQQYYVDVSFLPQPA